MNEIMPIDILVMVWVFVVGLCIGSFLNVVALRGLIGESIVFPPSKCPKCNNKLKWWMNIPVFSYIFLKGKCHYCKSPISIQYPIVEFLVGVLFLLTFLKFSYSIETIFYLIAISLLVAMSATDIKESVILDFHAYILILVGIIYSAIMPNFPSGLIFSLFGAFVGFILYEIIARSGYLFAGQRAFGEGDSLIAAGIGAFFGAGFVVLSFLISVLVMAVFTFPYFFWHCYKNGKKRTCIALFYAIILILISYIVSKFELAKTFEVTIIYLFFVILSCIFCVREILSDMNRTNENGEKSMCMLPFGPAMAISFILLMFFKPYFAQVVSFENFM